MECPYCLADEFLITGDFEFECKYCLSKLEQPEITEFIQKFSSAYLTKDNLSTIINDYFNYIKEFRFPFLIRDYVQSNYNYNLVAREIRTLPDYEASMIKKITSSDTRIGFDFIRSSEILNQIIVNQSSLPDLTSRLELLAITVANEEGSFPYLSYSDLEYIYQDPNANVILTSFSKNLKQLEDNSQKLAKTIVDSLSKRLRLQSKYFEELTPPAKFEVKKIESGITIVKCSDKSKTIRIPPIIHGEIVIAIDSKAFVSMNTETIEIPKTIKTISASSFIDMKYLKVVKLGNQTPIHPAQYLNCPNLQLIELSASHNFTNIDGIIYSADKKALIYFPPGLQKTTLELTDSIRVKHYSCYSANYLRDLSVDSSAIIIEDQSFRLDEHSRLSIDSKNLVLSLLKTPSSNKIDEVRELLDVNDKVAAKSVAKQLDDNDVESLLLRSQLEDDEAEKLELLIKAYLISENYIDQATILDEILTLKSGPENIALLEIKEPYLNYYLAMAHAKLKDKPVEKILQLFLDSYNAGNNKAGINASTLMKSQTSGVTDLGLTERILIDLVNKEDIQAKFKLLQFYNEYPHLCSMDLSSLVDDLMIKMPDEFKPLLADMLYKGTIVKEDKDAAIELMKELSEKGDKNMSYQLGYIYYSDYALKDIEESISYFNRAHLQGHKDAKRTILKIQQ